MKRKFVNSSVRQDIVWNDGRRSSTTDFVSKSGRWGRCEGIGCAHSIESTIFDRQHLWQGTEHPWQNAVTASPKTVENLYLVSVFF